MATNKIVLRTVEEFMTGYKPVYTPFYPLLLGSNSIAYAEEVGKINFNRLEAVGDLRAKNILPKDTEIFEVAVRNSAKTFKKYFKANRYVQSELQAIEDIDGIVSQVLDENQKLMDELFLFGEGTAANNVLNNGLYWSADANYTLESSAAVAASPGAQADMFAKIMTTVQKSRDVSGEKALIVYGTTAIATLDSLVPSQPVTLNGLLTQSIDFPIIRLPSAVTPSGDNGWIAVTLDQIKTHYTALPSLKKQGVNDEKMYSWHNFLLGSAMVEVLTKNGVIRQPVTFS
jgi:uncharacterized protein YeeX (DUF496 family)